MKKLKGFTLVELIVVIAIIGILAAILGLNMMNYIASSRIKSQNNNSRVIFNGAQSIVQEYKFIERKDMRIINDSGASLAEKNSAKSRINIGNGDFYFYWDASTGTTLKADGTATGDSEFNQDFARKVNKLFTGKEETVYKIYVKNYIVQSVVSGRTDSDLYIGSYPKKQTERISGRSVKDFDMTTIL